MVAAFLLAVLAQGQAPTVTATVDQDRVAVGDALVYTVEAVSQSSEPTQIVVAPVTGFQVMGRIERNEFSSAGQQTRTAVLELHLRALQAGRWRVGPARVIQGKDTVEASPIAVDVSDTDGAAPPVTLSPRARRLLQRLPPPSRGKPSVALLLSASAARVGEQVDVVTAAWFPRDLRTQLSRPPTLQPPVIEGVWTSPQATPVTIAASRMIGGMPYDLFVAHQAVFPLVAGVVRIPPATLRFSRPVGSRLLGREALYALQSQPTTFRADSLPSTGRPADFAGAVGSGLRLERRVSARAATAGQTLRVDYILSGEGNTALWPAPEAAWPETARTYRERVEEEVSTNTAGTLGGRKIFRFLVVSDSVGVLRLPGIRYQYFDLAAGRYREASIGPASLAVLAEGEGAASAALPPPLLPVSSPAWSWRLAHPIPDWAWLLLLALPPLAIAIYSRWPRRATRVTVAAPSDTLAAAERKFEAVLAAAVPESRRHDPRMLAAALRATNVDAETVVAVLAVRERLQAARYGPGDATDRDNLRRDVDALAERLVQSRYQWRGETVLGAIVLAAVLSAGATPLLAQTPSPEQLYETGALNAAAEGFARRAEIEPEVAAHWYGLGASYYRLGLKGHAASAWLQARRLAPRDGIVRRALALTPPPDAVSARQVWVPPVRPEELLLLGACGWLVAWFGWISRPRLRDRWMMLLVFSGLAVIGGLALRAWYGRPLGIADGVPELRLSPHGRASVIARLQTGGAVHILQTHGGWLLVRAPDDKEGWVPAEAIVPVGS